MNNIPYKRAAEEIKSHGEKPLKTLAAVGSAAASIYGGKAIIEKALPFLNEFIPAGLAIKGLQKVNPKLGDFMKDTLAAGFTTNEVKDFIKEKLVPTEKSKESPKENRNVIEQYSPELFQFVKEQLNQGRSPLEAGALAQLNQKFKGVISKMETDHKTPWSGILQTVFGNMQPPQAPQQQAQSPQMQQPQAPAQPQAPMQAQAPGQPQGQGVGPGQQALMQMIQKINQKLGG